MPKTKTKIKSEKELDTNLNSFDSKELSLEEKNNLNSTRNFKKLIDQVNSEYRISYDFMRPKWDEWGLRLKLNNSEEETSQLLVTLYFVYYYQKQF